MVADGGRLAVGADLEDVEGANDHRLIAVVDDGHAFLYKVALADQDGRLDGADAAGGVHDRLAADRHVARQLRLFRAHDGAGRDLDLVPAESVGRAGQRHE